MDSPGRVVVASKSGTEKRFSYSVPALIFLFRSRVTKLSSRAAAKVSHVVDFCFEQLEKKAGLDEQQQRQGSQFKLKFLGKLLATLTFPPWWRCLLG